MVLPSRGLLPIALLTLASIGQAFLKYGLQTIRIDTGPVTEAQDEIFGTRFDVPLYLYGPYSLALSNWPVGPRLTSMQHATHQQVLRQMVPGQSEPPTIRRP